MPYSYYSFFSPRVQLFPHLVVVTSIKSYNSSMSLKEFVEGSGVYHILASELPLTAWFIRDTRGKGSTLEIGNEKWKFYPLLHVCERDLDPDCHTPTYVVSTGLMRWDTMQGYYHCLGCKKRWRTEAELKAVWEDGLGTGDEGHA